ncbi:MAG: hypothetical protein ACFIN5_00620 [Candidatus Walczuchella monophlebidarum]
MKHESITPGIPVYYASTMFYGFDLASVLVSLHFKNVSSRVQASLLLLYENERLKGPSIKRQSVSWNDVDKYVISQLKQIRKKGKKIV